VATVAVGNARNAGLLAARILGAADEGLRQRLAALAATLATSVEERDAKVRAECPPQG
jgi:5-(carboxyamino)imidazole ribonucleotide mutase